MQNSNNTLFDNPMIQAARDAMTPEQIQQYKQIGEVMYENMDLMMAEEETIQSSQDPLIEFVAYITEGLQSGLHPSYLDKNEKLALEQIHGPEWYIRFGFEKSDVENNKIKRNDLCLCNSGKKYKNCCELMMKK